MHLHPESLSWSSVGLDSSLSYSRYFMCWADWWPSDSDLCALKFQVSSELGGKNYTCSFMFRATNSKCLWSMNFYVDSRSLTWLSISGICVVWDMLYPLMIDTCLDGVHLDLLFWNACLASFSAAFLLCCSFSSIKLWKEQNFCNVEW
jgi:hypothetical protein